MDKEKVIQELQERTEEIKEKAGELHKAIEETISQKKQIHYTELGGQDGQPDDGLDAHFPCRTVKVNDAIHNAMVGDGHAVHAKLFGPRRQLFDLTGTVQQTVLCMDVQMCKCHCLLLYILIKTGRKYHFHPAASASLV